MPMETEPLHEPTSGPYPGWVARFVLPFVENSALWPVTVAILGHVVLFQMLMLLGTVRDHGPGAALVLALCLFASGKILVEERRCVGGLGPLGWVTLGTWLLAVPAAWAAGAHGIF